MTRVIDLVGRRFGRLTVAHRDLSRRGGKAYWMCACECGGSVSVGACYLKDGRTKSCGCITTGRPPTAFVEYKGVRLSLKEWARKLRRPYMTLLTRVGNGWDVYSALAAPPRYRYDAHGQWLDAAPKELLDVLKGEPANA